MSFIMRLCAENVSLIFLSCLFRDYEDADDGSVVVKGIVNNVRFHSGRLKNHAAEIASMLDEFPERFHEGVGSRWRFPGACKMKYGNWQTCLYQEMLEQLIQLGVGIGQVQNLIPGEAWRISSHDTHDIIEII